MTDEQTESPYFWQLKGDDKRNEWYVNALTECLSEKIATEVKSEAKRFTFIYDINNEFCEYLICNFCKERVVFPVSDHLNECKVETT